MSSIQRDGYSLVTYRSVDIPSVWGHVEGHLSRALEHSNYTLTDLYVGLRKADMQLWTCQKEGIEAALVTTIQTDDVTSCLLLAVGGSKVGIWRHWLPHVEEWARQLGATRLLIHGRPGWARLLNFKIRYTVMDKSL